MRAARVVDAPDGRRWSVRRRWLPRMGAETVWGRFHRRFRQAMRRVGDAADADPGCLDVLGEGLVAAVLVIIGLLLLVFVVLPLLIAIVDVLIVVLLGLLSIVARVLLRRPWTVEATAATTDGSEPLVWKVVGWRASGDKVDEVADALVAGVHPQPAAEL
jgi:hypothetical protein